MEESTKALGYTLVNPDKVTRVLDGTQDERGVLRGGIRKADGSYDEKELIAGYDKIGGLIRKGEDKVRTGSFYDFTARRARVEPKVEFEFRVNGDVVYVPAEQEIPNKIKAVKVAEKQEKEKKAKKK